MESERRKLFLKSSKQIFTTVHLFLEKLCSKVMGIGCSRNQAAGSTSLKDVTVQRNLPQFQDLPMRTRHHLKDSFFFVIAEMVVTMTYIFFNFKLKLFLKMFINCTVQVHLK